MFFLFICTSRYVTISIALITYILSLSQPILHRVKHSHKSLRTRSTNVEHAVETSATKLLSFFCDMVLMQRTSPAIPNSFASSTTLQTLNLDVVNHHNFLNPWGRWCDDDAATRPDATPVIQCRCCDDNDGAMASLMTNTNGVSYVNAAPSWSSSDLSNPFAFSSSLFISKIEIFCCGVL